MTYDVIEKCLQEAEISTFFRERFGKQSAWPPGMRYAYAQLRLLKDFIGPDRFVEVMACAAEAARAQEEAERREHSFLHHRLHGEQLAMAMERRYGEEECEERQFAWGTLVGLQALLCDSYGPTVIAMADAAAMAITE